MQTYPRMLLRGTASHTGCGVLRPWSSRPPAVAGRTICRRQRQPLSVMSGQPRWGNCTLPTQHAIARGSKNAPNHFCFQHGRVIAGYRFCPAPRVAVLVGRGISRSLSAGEELAIDITLVSFPPFVPTTRYWARAAEVVE